MSEIKQDTLNTQTSEEDNTLKFGVLGEVLKSQYTIKCQLPINNHECILLTDHGQLQDLATRLKEIEQYQVLSLINCVEYKTAYQVIYQFIKATSNFDIVYIKVNLPKDSNLEIASLSNIYNSADWYEREIYDLQGIIFTGHNNLVRLLNPDQWSGYPLRKDYLPPLDALNAPITTVKANMKQELDTSTRFDIEKIVIPPEWAEENAKIEAAASDKQ